MKPRVGRRTDVNVVNILPLPLALYFASRLSKVNNNYLENESSKTHNVYELFLQNDLPNILVKLFGFFLERSVYLFDYYGVLFRI